MARIRATFVDSHDGWIDDQIAVVNPWAFDVTEIRVPVGIWHGDRDQRISSVHADWLANRIATAERRRHEGGHTPTAAVQTEMFAWLREHLTARRRR